MRVNNVDVFLLHHQFTLVKLTADDGTSGWGEATHHGAEMTAQAAATLGSWLKEMDEVTPEGAWQTLFRKGYRRGYTGAQMAALSAIDIALYDIVGRQLSVPVSTLLGGRVRDEADVYSSFMIRGFTPAEEVERVDAAMQRGFRHLKVHTGAPWSLNDKPDNTVSTVEAIREVWPSRSQLQLIIDVNNTYSVHEAIRVGRRLEALDVWWLEEAISPWDLAGYARLQEALDMPVSAGEQEFNLWQFSALILEAEIDILQPNLTTCGGFTVGRKIGALAETFNRPIATHNIDPSLMTAIHAQYWAATRMCTLAQEFYGEQSHSLRDVTPILDDPLPVIDGKIAIPDEPGLGVTVNEEVIRASADVISV